MYCPSCGSEDRQLSQFCRTCGLDLRPVRPANERVDALTASSISAREQLGVAIADKIRQVESGKELRRIAHEVLPAFEKFLQSPEEKRLRRVRAGVITTGVGLAATLAALLAALAEEDLIPLMIPTFIVFIVGLSVLINGLWFTLPRKKYDEQGEVLPPELTGFIRGKYEPPVLTPQTNDLALRAPISSVTDHTTHHLKSKP